MQNLNEIYLDFLRVFQLIKKCFNHNLCVDNGWSRFHKKILPYGFINKISYLINQRYPIYFHFISLKMITNKNNNSIKMNFKYTNQFIYSVNLYFKINQKTCL